MGWVRAKFLLASRLLSLPSGYSVLPQSSRHERAIFARSLRAPFRRIILLLRIALAILLCDITLTPIFWPSYTHLPPCYENLKKITSSSTATGRGNPHNAKVFIAAILYDRAGELASGPWGDALVQLIDLLGQDNVFLSLYETNSGQKGHQALDALAQRIQSNKSIVVDEQTTFDAFPRVTLPNGENRIKRIDYLAALRNRALLPLGEHTQKHIKYDRLLYLNDVYFNPVEALQLLLCTNTNTNTNTHPPRTSQATYRAACAVDFSNPFKFYDSYATRDLAGYGIGLPFFPWFTTAGHGQSRADVLAGRDAVRVRSCWGGMVAFDAWYFQKEQPVRFRAGTEMFWDASECCLVHADVQGAGSPGGDNTDIGDRDTGTGVYMNPFVRVGYTARTLAWLRTTRRFERLYAGVHDLLSRVVGLPRYNPRRAEVAGAKVQREVWVPDEGSPRGGSFRMVEVIAGDDGFCGRRGMEVVVEDRKSGQDGFDALSLPSL